MASKWTYTAYEADTCEEIAEAIVKDLNKRKIVGEPQFQPSIAGGHIKRYSTVIIFQEDID